MTMAELTYREAVAAASRRRWSATERSCCIGEDIGAAGGVFKTTDGLLDEFGPERVSDTPISEQAIVGAAMGAAMTGLRPIAEMMFSDFFAVVLGHGRQPDRQDALHDRRPGGAAARHHAPANGGGLRFGAQHSQSIENWAMAIPGLKVVAPSTPADVVGLMAAAIRDADPVIFCEHKGLFADKGEVPDGEIVDSSARRGSSARAPTRRSSRWRLMVPRAPAAAEDAAADTASTPRSSTCARLVPLDIDDGPRLGRARRGACSPSRRTRGCAAGAPRSSRSSPRRRSATSTGRSCGSRRRTSRLPSAPCWRTSPMPSAERIAAMTVSHAGGHAS